MFYAQISILKWIDILLSEIQAGIFVYVIGLHAVQFVNNWMKNVPRTAKLDKVAGRVLFCYQTNFFIQFLQIGQACSLLTY